MKLLNNRYSINNSIKNQFNNEEYIIRDLMDKENTKRLRVLQRERDPKAVEWCEKNFIWLSLIKHKNLLDSESFGAIETINLKKINNPIYYLVTGYSDLPKMAEAIIKSNLEHRIRVLLEIMNTVDYIHFRGFVIKYLSPDNILYSKDSIKLSSLARIMEMNTKSYYNEFVAFMAPEVLMDKDKVDYKADYYSIGMLMKYLLYDDNIIDKTNINYIYEDDLNNSQKLLLNNIIDNLTIKIPQERIMSLRDIINSIIDAFDIDIEFDLKSERDRLFFKIRLVGLNNELDTLLKEDNEILENTNNYKGCLIRGGNGVGKKRLIDEFVFRMRIRGRDVLTFNSTENDILGVSVITRFIQAIEAYKNRFLVGTQLDVQASLSDYMEKDLYLTNKVDKYDLFIKVFNDINEISKKNNLYIVIKHFDKTNDIFVELIDYLLNCFNRNSVYLIIGLNDNCNRYSDRINKWIGDNLVRNISLSLFNLNDTGNLVKETLGINYVPVRLSRELFINSKGNPGLIRFFLRDLYDREELYMDERGFWELRNHDLSKLKLPSSYTEIIDTQLMKYDSKTIEVIEVLSVFQIRVTKQTIKKIINTKLRIITSIIDELLLDGIIETEINDDIIYYRLTSDEMSLRVYSGIPLEKRESMHLTVANLLMGLYSSRMYKVIDEIVHHLTKANKPNIAIGCLIKEAEKLDRKTDLISINLWEKAFDLAKDTDCKDILKILDSLTYIYEERGETEKTEYYNNILLKRSEAINNQEYRIKAISYHSNILMKKNKIKDVLVLIQELKHLSVDWDSHNAMIEALIIEGKTLSYMNEESKMIDVLKEAERLVYKYKMKSYLGNIYNLYGIAYNMIGDYEKSIDSYQKSIEFFMKSFNQSGVVKPINNLGFLYSSIDNVDKSLEYYEMALEIAKKHGSISSRCVFLNNLGETYYNKLDYDQARKYLMEAKKLAEDINDIKDYFLSIIILGLIDLDTNNFDSAYKKFLYLEELNTRNPIIEGEIKSTYDSFLGSFYTMIGDFNKAEKSIANAIEFYKENGIRELLKSKSNLAVLRILKNRLIDKDEIYSILNSYSKTGFIYDYLKFILVIAKYSLIFKDLNFAKDLYRRYYGLREKANSEFLDAWAQLIEKLIKGDKSSLLKVEKSIYNSHSMARLFKDTDIRVYLANVYYDKGWYLQSLRSYFKALDCLYTMTRFVDSKEHKNRIFNTKNTQIIENRIRLILEARLKKDLSDYPIRQGKPDQNTLLETASLVNCLSNEEYYHVFYKDFRNVEIRDLNSLLMQLGDNYNENLDMILSFLANETMAERGMIILTDGASGELHVASTTVNNDFKLPNDAILLNSLRNREALLYSRNLKEEVASSHLQEIIPKELTAFICIPITSYKRNMMKELSRRRWDTIQDNQLFGYLYLESSNLLNRFDKKRSNLAMSLNSVLYLNIQNNRMMKISINDKVTGTYTRKYLEERLDSLLDIYRRTNSSFSLLMVDIDRFKSINDTYGHMKGDKVLGLVGKIIMDSVRESDIVGRYGGEEFLVVLNNSRYDNAVKIADKIRKNIESALMPGIERSITASIGVSHYPLHSAFKDELIIKADQALYYAKEVMGRNKCVEWFSGIDSILSKSNKLTGIITGDYIKDNNNLSALVDICELIKENKSYEEKVEFFLDTILEAVGGEYASLLTSKSNVLSKKRDLDDWATSYTINLNLLDSILESKEGKYFIDWEKPERDDDSNNILEWLSVLVVPLIKEGNIKAVLYITVSAKEKEFEARDLNLCSVLSNVFAGTI